MKTRISLVLTSFLAAATTAAAPVEVDGFTAVRSVGDFDEYRLQSNGLQVLLMPEHSAPVVTVQVTYRVGSRNEVTGTTGATHLLEHFMFKGTDAYNDEKGNSLKQYVNRVGAAFGGITSLDRTNYAATLARGDFEIYLAMEADRMRNLWLRQSDLAAEMTVVRNEYERGENSPTSALLKEVTATAYRAHPYHHPTIGWRSDIENVPIEKLREFYDTFYWPNNATLQILGDFDPAQMLALVRRYFGGISASPRPIPQVYTQEPEQTGPRRVTVKRPGQIGAVLCAHKGVAATDPDYAALVVLDLILSGGRGSGARSKADLVKGSAAGAGNTSRLHAALVDTGLAASVAAYARAAKDPSLHTIDVTLTPGTRHEQVEQVISRELAKVRDQGVTDAEVKIAQRQYRAQTAFARDNLTGIALALNDLIGAGDWSLYYSLGERVAAQTPADVQRVARKYLNEDQSTTGFFVPQPAAPASDSAAGRSAVKAISKSNK